MTRDAASYIPAYYKRDKKFVAFANKLNSIYTQLEIDTGLLTTLQNGYKVNRFIDELAYLVGANIIDSDTERTKRIKTMTAIQGHKRRGSFADDAKPKIDAVAGGDSEILKSSGGSEWILVGDGGTPVDYYWASIGADGIDDGYGLDLMGAGDEVEVAGNIYINVDNDSLSLDDQELIRLSLLDLVPAYCYVHIGYINGTDQFHEYFLMGVA